MVEGSRTVIDIKLFLRSALISLMHRDHYLTEHECFFEFTHPFCSVSEYMENK